VARPRKTRRGEACPA